MPKQTDPVPKYLITNSTNGNYSYFYHIMFMKMKPLILPISIALMLVFTSFARIGGDKDLPPITHTGENVMACRVNGHVIIAAENSADIANPTTVRFSSAPDNELIYIGGVFISPRYDIEISFKYQDTLGVYPIIDKYPYFGYFWDYTKSVSANDSNQFFPDKVHTGSINVLYNDGNIISGTFAFDGINRKGKVVHITDGRFDIAKH